MLVHERFDEVIVSTLPERVSQWLKRDLPSRIERLELPVTVVRAKEARRPLHEPPLAACRYSQPARLNERCSASAVTSISATTSG